MELTPENEVEFMDKHTKEDLKTGSLIATGMLTEYTFLQSLRKSKTLMVMTVIGLIIFASLGLLFYSMSAA